MRVIFGLAIIVFAIMAVIKRKKQQPIKIFIIGICISVLLFAVSGVNNTKNPDNEQNSTVYKITYGQQNEISFENEAAEGEYLYKLPAGNYKATLLDETTAKGAMLVIKKDEVYINESGFKQHENIYISDMMHTGDSIEISVKDDECISITSGAAYEFTLIE